MNDRPSKEMQALVKSLLSQQEVQEQQLAEVKRNVINLNSRLTDVVQENKLLKEQLNELKNNIPIQPSSGIPKKTYADVVSTPSQIVDIARRVRKENQMQSSREENVVIIGVREQSADDDKLIVEEIANEISVDISDLEISPKRLGKEVQNKSRPIRVKLDRNRRDEFLKSAPCMRNFDHRKEIYIAPDLTVEQQKAAFNLRNELRSVRQANPSKKFAIKSGKIVELTTEKSSDNHED